MSDAKLPNLPACVRLERGNGLAVVTLDRGADVAGGHNPLSAEAMTALRDVARWLKTDIDTHCVILRGATSFTLDVEREGDRVEYAYLLE